MCSCGADKRRAWMGWRYSYSMKYSLAGGSMIVMDLFLMKKKELKLLVVTMPMITFCSTLVISKEWLTYYAVKLLYTPVSKFIL